MTDLEAYELERRLGRLPDDAVVVMNGKQFRDFMAREQARGERKAFMEVMFVTGGLPGVGPAPQIITNETQFRMWMSLQLEGARAKVRVLEQRAGGPGGGQ